MKTRPTPLTRSTVICCLLVLTSSDPASAQIIYTDIPDATPDVTYPLDLDNDAMVDFDIQMAAPETIVCTPQNDNAYSGELVAGMHLPWALSASTEICPSLVTWYGASGPGTMALGTGTGHWVDQTDTFLALRLVVGTNTYYGWARLDVSGTSSSFTIKDYAYESTPDACIEAGLTATGIHENTTGGNMSVFPNPFSVQATLQADRMLCDASLTVHNSYGQIVDRMENISGRSVILFRRELPSGVYFLRLTEGDESIAGKQLVIID